MENTIWQNRQLDKMTKQKPLYSKVQIINESSISDTANGGIIFIKSESRQWLKNKIYAKQFKIISIALSKVAVNDSISVIHFSRLLFSFTLCWITIAMSQFEWHSRASMQTNRENEKERRGKTSWTIIKNNMTFKNKTKPIIHCNTSHYRNDWHFWHSRD